MKLLLKEWKQEILKDFTTELLKVFFSKDFRSSPLTKVNGQLKNREILNEKNRSSEINDKERSCIEKTTQQSAHPSASERPTSPSISCNKVVKRSLTGSKAFEYPFWVKSR